MSRTLTRRAHGPAPQALPGRIRLPRPLRLERVDHRLAVNLEVASRIGERRLLIETLAGIEQNREKLLGTPKVARDAAVDQRHEGVEARVLGPAGVGARREHHRVAVGSEAKVFGDLEEIVADHVLVDVPAEEALDQQALPKDVGRDVLELGAHRNLSFDGSLTGELVVILARGAV